MSEFITLNMGDEAIRAYSKLPGISVFNCNLENFLDENILNNPIDVDGTGETMRYVLPIDDNGNTANFDFECYVTAYSPDDPKRYFDSVYDEIFGEYVLSKNATYDISGHSIRLTIRPTQTDTLGFFNSTKSTMVLEFKKAVVSWGDEYSTNYLSSLVDFQAEDPSRNNNGGLAFCYTNTGEIVDWSSDTGIMTNETRNETPFNIELNVPYTFKIVASKDVLNNLLTINIYINNEWRYTGQQPLDNGGWDNYTDGSFVINSDYYENVGLYKLGSFKLTQTSTGVKGSCSYSSLVDPDVIANAEDVDGDGVHLKYSIPIEYEDGSIKYITAEHPYVGDTYQNVICTNVEFNSVLNEYVISRNTQYWGISGGTNTGMQIYSDLGPKGPLGFQGDNTITLEFNMIINEYYSDSIVYLCSFNDGSFTFTDYNSPYCLSFAYHSGTKKITDLAGIPTSLNESINLQTSLDLETPYNFKIVMHKEVSTNTLYAYISIDGNLVYSGYTELVSNIEDYTNGYFTLGFSNRNYKAKLGGFRITYGQKIEYLNVKYNDNLYYILCSNYGNYPSRMRTKINGSTYPILLKHDGDTSE